MSSLERMDKLNSEFCKEICHCLQNEVKNPNITEMYTVLAVEADRLLANAKVYISIYSTDKIKTERTFKAICACEPFIRHCLSRRMRIRKVPVFNFILDSSFEKGQKIDDLINEIHKDDI